jgi:superfamily II DNA or RNA helicase
MKLSDLVAARKSVPKNKSQEGGVCVIDQSRVTPAATAYFNAAMRALDKQPFWSAAEQQASYRPASGLWAPQRRAIGVCLAYIGAQLAQRTEESALVKMPTGTGKTGVVATMACAVPEIRRTLIITPRKTLVGQMVEDIHYRFWKNFGLIYSGTELRARAADEKDPPESKVKSDSAGVVRLLPTNAVDLCDRPAQDRLVIVSTFTALEQILRPIPPAHRLTGRFPPHVEEVPVDQKGKDTLSDTDHMRVLALLRGVDLVIVDEGHYEPAFVWSQCIRMLNRPTVLLSATPYRNDFKYFSVRGNFAFNLSYQEATEQALIRKVEFAAPKYVPKHADGVGEFVRALNAYYCRVVQKMPWPSEADPPRVIVRAKDYDGLVLLRDTLAAQLSMRCVFIHDRVGRDDPSTLEFGSATAAINAPETQGVTYWLHQWKLLEGVDEKKFATVAVFQPFTNSRAAIQQVGRVLRFMDPTRGLAERATVFADDEVIEDLQARFDRYKKYEEYFDQDPQEALTREARLPALLLKYAAPYQYLFGDFRERFGLDDEARVPGFHDFNLPLRASIYRYTGRESIDAITERCREAMGLEERYEARVIRPKLDEPQNARLVVYLTWKNSELLNSHSLPIWDLGVMVLVFAYPRVFVYDTSGLVIALQKVEFEPEPVENLRSLIPVTSKKLTARVAQASAIGLDLSESAIRSVTARMRDFNATFYDLAQSKQVLNSLRAYIHSDDRSKSRYVSLDRSSVSDTENAVDRVHDVQSYVAWTKTLTDALDSSAQPSGVFRRFAQSVPAPKASDAAPVNVLFDFFDHLVHVPGSFGWSVERCEQLRNAELCADIDGSGAFKLLVDGTPIAGTITYSVTGNVRPRGRYEIESPELDKFVRDPQLKVAEPMNLVKQINKEQAFRVIPHAPNLVYAARRFYLDDLDLEAIKRGDEKGTPLERLRQSNWMAQVTSEKGSGTAAQWVKNSIFGGMFAEFGLSDLGAPSTSHGRPVTTHDPDLSAELATFHTVVCDDGGNEKADFILVSENPPKVVLIHAKVNDTKLSLNAMQIVGRQAQASLAWMVRGRREASRAKWWGSPWSTDDLQQVPHRILRSATLDFDTTWSTIQEALLSARYSKEMWIMAGSSLSRTKLISQLTRTEGPTPISLQMAHYLATLQTAVARANVGMRIYCSP